MRRLLTMLSLVISISTTAQIDTLNQEMVPMSETFERSYKVGSVYYKNGTKKPYTGVLYGKYDNGNYLTIQEYKNGVGNGKWVNYYPDGTIKELGTYRDNRVEGPYKEYHKNGNIKSEGNYKHWKKKVGIWKFYDEDGILLQQIHYGQE